MRLIDADAVDYENIMCSLRQLEWLNAIIEKQPTIDAVPVVHGRWLITTVDCVNPIDGSWENEIDVRKCSECRGIFDISEALNYCPHCGAKMMDGERKDNES